MGQKYMFKTVSFNGFDKEEVLAFLKETIADFEDEKNSLATALENAHTQIHALEKQVSSLEVSNQELTISNNQLEYLYNQQISNNTKLENKYRGYKEKYESISAALVDAKDKASKIIDDAYKEREAVLNGSKDTKISLVSNPEVTLNEYEARYIQLQKNLKTLAEATEIISSKYELLKKTTDDIQKKITIDLLNNGNNHE